MMMIVLFSTLLCVCVFTCIMGNSPGLFSGGFIITIIFYEYSIINWVLLYPEKRVLFSGGGWLNRIESLRFVCYYSCIAVSTD